MPSKVSCEQTNCSYNKESDCNASVIRVRAEGMGQNNTYCETATDSDNDYENMQPKDESEVGNLRFEIGESLEPRASAPRVACTVGECVHNNSYVCAYSGSLDVKEANKRFSPLCADFSRSL